MRRIPTHGSIPAVPEVLPLMTTLVWPSAIPTDRASRGSACAHPEPKSQVTPAHKTQSQVTPAHTNTPRLIPFTLIVGFSGGGGGGGGARQPPEMRGLGLAEEPVLTSVRTEKRPRNARQRPAIVQCIT